MNGCSSVTGGSALYTSFVLGDNYLEFTVTSAGTSLDGSFYTPTNDEAEFNGLQIVQVSAVPEPAACALLASLATFGFVVLCGRCRRQPRRRHA